MCAGESDRFTGIVLTLRMISASLMHVFEGENHPNRQDGRAKNQGGEC